MKKFLLWTFCAWAVLAMSAARAEVVVIVHPKNPTAAISPEQVSAIFLGKSMTLPSGGGAVVIDQPESSPLYESFYSAVAGKTPAQVKAIWARLTFSGRAMPPKMMSSSAEVKKFVASNPEAIGYIEKAAVDATVKVVLKVD